MVSDNDVDASVSGIFVKNAGSDKYVGSEKYVVDRHKISARDAQNFQHQGGFGSGGYGAPARPISTGYGAPSRPEEEDDDIKVLPLPIPVALPHPVPSPVPIPYAVKVPVPVPVHHYTTYGSPLGLGKFGAHNGLGGIGGGFGSLGGGLGSLGALGGLGGLNGGLGGLSGLGGLGGLGAGSGNPLLKQALLSNAIGGGGFGDSNFGNPVRAALLSSRSNPLIHLLAAPYIRNIEENDGEDLPTIDELKDLLEESSFGLTGFGDD